MTISRALSPARHPRSIGPLDAAYANTLRTALGYGTGLFYDFGVYLQFEDVRVADNDAYNDGGSNGVFDQATVVDPEGTEINQAYLRYLGIPYTTLKLGRQEIEHRPPPLHRYIGNILWRQNWQSFDAVRTINEYLPATVIDYAYAWNTNRIFGEDNELPDRSDFRMDSHFMRIDYSGFAIREIRTVYLFAGLRKRCLGGILDSRPSACVSRAPMTSSPTRFPSSTPAEYRPSDGLCRQPR